MSLPTSVTESEAPPAIARPVFGRSLLREIVETLLLTAVIYGAVNLTTGRFRIEGPSMEPTLYQNERVVVDKVSYRLGDPRRGDIVVFNYPLATEKDFIKRVIGLPGDQIDVVAGRVFVNGQELTEPYIFEAPAYDDHRQLGPEQFYVLGDHRNSSSDSHNWGPLDRKYLIGRAVLIYWPPAAWGVVEHFTYNADP